MSLRANTHAGEPCHHWVSVWQMVAGWRWGRLREADNNSTSSCVCVCVCTSACTFTYALVRGSLIGRMTFSKMMSVWITVKGSTPVVWFFQGNKNRGLCRAGCSSEVSEPSTPSGTLFPLTMWTLYFWFCLSSPFLPHSTCASPWPPCQSAARHPGASDPTIWLILPAPAAPTTRVRLLMRMKRTGGNHEEEEVERRRTRRCLTTSRRARTKTWQSVQVDPPLTSLGL